MRHDRRVALAAFLGGLPAVGAFWWLAARAGLTPALRWTLVGVVTTVWLVGVAVAQAQVVRPLQTLANILAALREGDFSFRAREADPQDPLGLAMHEANLLTTTLREERLRALESAALLRRVMGEIDVAVFAFDEGARLRLVNRQGERLLARPAERLVGETAEALGLVPLLGDGDGAGGTAGGGTASGTPRVMAATFPGGAGRWEVRRGVFRQGGRPHALLLVTDLSETLRAEERLAWQRLVRVLSHEINNSLAPIKTIAGSLLRRVRSARARAAQEVAARDVTTSGAIAAFGTSDDDFAYGLAVVAERADALGRFIGAYARLSRLPAPSVRPVEVAAWVRRVAALERRVPVTVREGPALTIAADPDQLEQLLINVVRNAADAVRELAPEGGATSDAPAAPAAAAAGARVTLWWDAGPGVVRVVVEDDGPGLADTANLFVPFYSTKPEGSGIGLALCRQIAEQHGGTVTLENRTDARGCRATVTLPR